MKNYVLLFLAAFMLVAISCEKEPDMAEEMEEEMTTECKTEGVSYEGEIKSILSGCLGSSCHAGSTSRSMANYADAVAYAKQGRIMGAIKHDAGFSMMPKNGTKLDACKIFQVAAWIDTDYPEN